MKTFEYARPSSLDEAIELLGEDWGQTEVLAGGTDLVTAMKQRITTPDRVVSLQDIEELRGVSEEDGALRIGAMTPIGPFMRDSRVREHFPALSTAMEGMAAPQVYSRATIGGNLCQRPRCWYFRLGYGLLAQDNGRVMTEDGENRYHAIFGNDGAARFVHPSGLAPGFIALNAEIHLLGPDGARSMAMEDFFRIPSADGERETALAPNEVVTHVTVPLNGKRNATYEVRDRGSLNWPLTAAAVAFSLNNGVAEDVRIVLGHVAPTPWDAPEAAEALEGAAPDEETAIACGNAAVEGATPLSRNGYKTQLVRTSVKRAILAAAQQA